MKDISKEQFRNIVVRLPNWLGDCVMATPVLKRLREHYPDAKITAMCQHNIVQLMAHDPHLDAIRGFKKPSGWLHRKQHREIIEPLRKEQFDLGVLLTNSFSSAWWLWRAGVRYRIGFSANMRSFALSHPLPYPKDKETQHLVYTYQALLQPLGMMPAEIYPRLFLQASELETAENNLRQCGWDPARHYLVGINPGAAYGSAKCWLPERFESLTRKLLEDPNCFVVFFGDSGGKALVDGICAQFSDRVLNFAAKTSLRELMSLIQVCDLFLSNDSGPMHIAAALQVPLVALFGSTSDVKTGPFGAGPITVIHKHVECSPCYKRVCPIDFRCMKRIEVDEVYQALMALRQAGQANVRFNSKR